jgi:hypothetical protein
MATNFKFTSNNTMLYLSLAAVVAVIAGIAWCFMSGPCGGGASTSSGKAPGSGLAGVVGAATDAISALTQQTVGASNPANGTGDLSLVQNPGGASSSW